MKSKSNSLPRESKVPSTPATQTRITAFQLAHVQPAGPTAKTVPAASLQTEASKALQKIKAISGRKAGIALPAFLQVLHISSYGHHH